MYLEGGYIKGLGGSQLALMNQIVSLVSFANFWKRNECF